MIHVKDQLHRGVKIERPARRIVSLVPSLTELLADLGLENQIVGVTRFCVHPEHIRKKASVVGGTKQVRNQKIKKLEPDLIIANKEENQREDVQDLESICSVHVSDVHNIEDCLELIKQYGRLTNNAESARQIIHDLKNTYEKFKVFAEQQVPIKVAYLIWKDPWMAVGGDSFIHEMLKINKFENIFSDKKRYPEVDLQDLNQADYVFLSTEPYPFKEEHFKEIPLDNSKIKIVDGEYFSWYGSRLIQAFDYFKSLRHELSV